MGQCPKRDSYWWDIAQEVTIPNGTRVGDKIMSKIQETGLIIKKESKFDKIRDKLLMLFFKKDYILIQELEELLKPKRVNTKKIIIPEEIGKNNKKQGV